ncbi:MAG: hypothetical protein K8R59_00395 [Thermoanaerobaculales bacterium]|nr:hypothetical protein [Thermoanaerobaculales bacterium]
MSDIASVLRELGLREMNLGACTGEWIESTDGKVLASINPADGSTIASVMQADGDAYEKVAKKAHETFPS